MYLKRLTISNYKSFFEPKEFNFEPGFNVLLGGNSSGKTTVLEAICFHEQQNTPHRSILNATDVDTLLGGVSGVERCFVGAFDEIRKLVPPGQEIYVGIGDQARFYTQDMQILTQRLVSEELMFDEKMDYSAGRFSRLSFDGWPSVWRELGSSASFPGLRVRGSDTDVMDPSTFGAASRDLEEIFQRLSSRIYKFSSERSVQAAYPHQGSSELLPNSANLAYCINHLAQSSPDLSKELNSFLHRVFPSIHWVAAPPNGSSTLFELKVHTTPSHLKRTDLAVPINRVGTGVGNALAMLYVALTAQTQRFILLEEPNSFLHPRALRELLAIFAEIGGKHQFFITTHSSDVLRTIKASTVTLLEYDGRQTMIKQTRGDSLHELKAGLVDLGISLTDLHGCDRVLWVEGETEAAIFPLLLRYFFPELAQGIAVLPLHATGDFEARKYEPKKVATIYKTLSEVSFLAPPMVAITLDRERKSDSLIKQLEIDCKGIVYFLPKIMLEDYLLDVDAIASVISKESGSQISSESVATAIAEAAKNKSSLLNPLKPGGTELHAAKVLIFIFEHFAAPQYHKTAHGPKIAEWLLTNKPEAFTELKDWFGQFLGGKQ